MPINKQELDQVQPQSDKYLRLHRRLTPWLGPPLRLLWRIGPIRRWLDRTPGARVGAISRLAEKGEHDRAVETAIAALKETRDQPQGMWRPNGSDYWWMFMVQAARSVLASGDRQKMDELVAMARDGVPPIEGYQVAQTFLIFSRWKFKAGDFDQALAFANDAAHADPTWAEPDFVLGWYCLAMDSGDAVPHLLEAIRKDPKVLSRVKKDPLCLRHPQVIERLKAK